MGLLRWLPVHDGASNNNMERRRRRIFTGVTAVLCTGIVKAITGLTWYWVAVVKLDFMFTARHCFYQMFYAFVPLDGISIPYDGRCCPVKLGQTFDSVLGVIREVVELYELFCSASRYVDAVGLNNLKFREKME